MFFHRFDLRLIENSKTTHKKSATLRTTHPQNVLIIHQIYLFCPTFWGDYRNRGGNIMFLLSFVIK